MQFLSADKLKGVILIGFMLLLAPKILSPLDISQFQFKMAPFHLFLIFYSCATTGR